MVTAQSTERLVRFRSPYVPLPRMNGHNSLDRVALDHAACETHFSREAKADFTVGRCSPALSRMVPHFSLNGIFSVSDLEETIEGIGGTHAPCAMRVSSIEELETHMLLAYEIAAAHYSLAKHGRMKDGRFPHMCCGFSSENVTLSLLANGYANATVAANMAHDHWYVVLPFVFGDDAQRGNILVDPTAEQTLRSTPRPKVLVEVKRNLQWEYRTHWQGGANLYPDALRMMNLEKRPKRNGMVDAYDVSKTLAPAAYFGAAFENVVSPPTVTQ